MYMSGIQNAEMVMWAGPKGFLLFMHFMEDPTFFLLSFQPKKI